MIFFQWLTNFITVRIPYCTLHSLSQGPQNLNFLTFMACPFLHQIHVSRHNLQRSDRLLADYSEERLPFLHDCVSGYFLLCQILDHCASHVWGQSVVRPSHVAMETITVFWMLGSENGSDIASTSAPGSLWCPTALHWLVKSQWQA